MKKLLLITWLMIGSMGSLLAQPTAYVSFSPADLGLGMRVDMPFNHFGAYIVATEGNYKFAEDWYVKNHIKLAVGGILYNKSDSFYSMGLSYHTYGEVKSPYEMPRKALMPISFEVGTGIYLGRLCTAIRVDPLKWDVMLDVGIRF